MNTNSCSLASTTELEGALPTDIFYDPSRLTQTAANSHSISQQSAFYTAYDSYSSSEEEVVPVLDEFFSP